MTVNFKEEHLTAYVLGELAGDQRAVVEEEISANPEVRKLALELEDFFGLVKREISSEPEIVLGDARAKALDEVFEGASPKAVGIAPEPSDGMRNKFQRYALVSGLAASITLALFFVMHTLIAQKEGEQIENASAAKPIEIVRVRPKSEDIAKEPELPKKAELKDMPPPPPIDIPSGSGKGEAIAIKIDVPKLGPVRPEIRMNDDRPSPGDSADSDIVPLVRIQPVYPTAAAQQRIEGWVVIEFTISANGSVESAKVVESEPPSIFDSSALAAIRKWKYKPKIEDGQRVERPGVRVKLTFDLDDRS